MYCKRYEQGKTKTYSLFAFSEQNSLISLWNSQDHLAVSYHANAIELYKIAKYKLFLSVLIL